MVIECKVLCFNRKLEELGVDDDKNEVWLPCAINVADIESIDNNNSGEARIYLKSGMCFVLNLGYEYVVHLFKFYHKKNEPWLADAQSAWRKDRPAGYVGPRNEDC